MKTDRFTFADPIAEDGDHGKQARKGDKAKSVDQWVSTRYADRESQPEGRNDRDRDGAGGDATASAVIGDIADYHTDFFLTVFTGQ